MKLYLYKDVKTLRIGQFLQACFSSKIGLPGMVVAFQRDRMLQILTNRIFIILLYMVSTGKE